MKPGLAAALALGVALATAAAKEPPGLSTANFVDVGDALTDMLNTSGLAFSTMLIGSGAALPAKAVTAAFQPSQAPRNARRIDSPCPGGGSVEANVRDADNDGDLSIGDRFVSVFKSCMIDGSLVSGRSEFVVASHRYEGVLEITELRFTFTGLGTDELRWTGPAHVVLQSDLRRGTERYVVTYDDLAVSRGARQMRWRFSLAFARSPAGDQVASVHGAMSLGDLHLRLRQDEPYVISGAGVARAGQLTATDDRGARLEVEAGRWRYAYRLFRAGNRGDVPDAASQSRPHGRR